MDKPYKVYISGSRPTFERWIAERGGVRVWENHDLSSPSLGLMFTPVRGPDGHENEVPPRWSHRKLEDCTDIRDFKIVASVREVGRFRVGVERGDGLALVLTAGAKRRLQRELARVEGSMYRFDVMTQEAVIEVPVWEDG